MRFVVTLLACAGLMAGTMSAQDKSAPKVRSRGIEIEDNYNKGRADGMRVLLKKIENGQPVAASPNQIFHTGDRIQLEFESNFDGYVYVVNVSPSGRMCVLYPYADERNNLVRARQPFSIPSLRQLVFNSEVGDEVLQVYMGRQPIPLFDQALKMSAEEQTKACLSETAASAAAELSSSPSKKPALPPTAGISVNPTMTLPSQKGIRSRGMELAFESKSEKGSVVAVAPDKDNMRLADKEVAIYELRLRHQ
jgi:hypothetical protein